MKRTLLFGLILFQVFTFKQLPASSSSKDPVFNDVTIVVASCDKYSELWKPFFHLLFKYWPSLKTYNAHLPIILISNKEDFTHDRVLVHKTIEDKSWSNNLYQTLKRVKTKYVLYLQEDFLLYKPVQENRLLEIFQGIQRENVPYAQLTEDTHFEYRPAFTPIKETVQKYLNDVYRVACHAVFFETRILKQLLKLDENAWEFEIQGSIRSQKIRAPFICVSKNEPISHINACYKGSIARPVLFFLEKEGIPIVQSTLPVRDDFFVYGATLKTKLYLEEQGFIFPSPRLYPLPSPPPKCHSFFKRGWDKFRRFLRII